MDNEVYLDTRYIDEHVSQLQDERRTAQRLRNAVIMTRDLGDPLLAAQYGGIIRSVDKLVRYCSKMGDTLEDISFDAKKLQQRLKRMVEEDTDWVRTENNKIML